MNAYLLSVLLGIIEGLTEFLPVSSTAHLRIAEALLNIDLANPYWKMYTIVIQLGAILSLFAYFGPRITRLLSTFPGRDVLRHPLTLVMVAFVVTAGPAFLLQKVIGKNLESLRVIGSALLIGGIVMWIVDAMNKPYEAKGEKAGGRIGTWRMEDMHLGQAIWIGACQITSAVFPGTSRSMSTIAGGQIAGMSRAAALEFSFFVSIPTMIVATCYDLLKSLRGGPNPLGAAAVDANGWVVLGIGFVVSFIVAYFTVAWFMSWVRTRGFAPFAIYRLIAGAAVLAWVALA
jgi:undecaprenyl-diphosphatase